MLPAPTAKLGLKLWIDLTDTDSSAQNLFMIDIGLEVR